jgi:hypothetical protein
MTTFSQNTLLARVRSNGLLVADRQHHIAASRPMLPAGQRRR